jgi:hypothetical protein
MTKITTMDKAAANALGAATQEALREVAERFGVTLKGGGGSYDPFSGSYKPRIEFLIPEVAAKAQERTATLYGLPEGSIGKTFTSQGRTFEITGFNARATKMPVIAKDTANGKSYKFELQRIVRLLEAAA